MQVLAVERKNLILIPSPSKHVSDAPKPIPHPPRAVSQSVRQSLIVPCTTKYIFNLRRFGYAATASGPGQMYHVDDCKAEVKAGKICMGELCDERLIEAALHFLRCVLFALDGRGDVDAEQGLISGTLFSHGQRGEW